MPTALRDHAGQFTYLGLGAYDNFLPFMSFRPVAANLADRLALTLQGLFGVRNPPERFAEISAVRTLQRDIGRPLVSALFYNRDAHAVANVAGFVQTDNAVNFVKIFRYAEEAIFQKFQADFVAAHFNGPFLTMAVTASTPFALFFQFSRRHRDITAADHIERKLLHVTEILLREKALHKSVAEMLPLDLGAVLARAGLGDLLARIHAWRDAQTMLVDIVPVHGDMTPLNIFVNDEEKHVIVNYERAGWHVAYYDYLHFVLHKRQRGRKAAALQDLVFDVAYEGLETNIILYLIDQIYQTLSAEPLQTTENGFTSRLLTLVNWLQAKIVTV